MSIETEIGQMAARLMEEIEGEYGPDAKLQLAALVVAVDHGDQTTVHHSWQPENPSVHEGLGLLEYVSRYITGRHT